MSNRQALLTEIEALRNRIDQLRQEIWQRDKINQTTARMEYELEKLLLEYLQHIKQYEEIAC
jgi:hypothetical protein